MRQLRRRAIAYGCLVVLAGLCACSRPEPKSPIVEKVEQAGSGNLAAVSKDGMREWLGKHKDVAYQVDEMCKPVRQNSNGAMGGVHRGTAMHRRSRTRFLSLRTRDQR